VEKLTTVGIDLAKDVIAVCVLDGHGAVIERRVLRRAAFERWAERLPASAVAMEACGSAHHWGRWFAARGPNARLIAAEFVVPFRKGGKNDTADAEAIAIAARQPTMRFVPIKTVEQQAILAWHSVREGWKEERTALLNRVRGLLAEYGVVIGRSADRLLTALPKLSEDSRLPDPVRAMLLDLGARRDLSITAQGCEAPAAQVRLASPGPTLNIVVNTPVLPDAKLKPPRAEELQQLAARFEPFTITSDAFRNMGVADCELVEDFAQQILSKFVTRGLKQDISCVPFQQSGGRYLVRGEILRALPPR